MVRIAVAPATPQGAPEIIFAALDAAVARELEPQLADAGCAVVSNSSALRMQSDVPLVIPEVNPDHIALIDAQSWRGAYPRLRRHQSQLLRHPTTSSPWLRSMAGWNFESVMAVTMQAVSGAGYPGVASLEHSRQRHPLHQNAEEKMEEEAQKLVGKLNGGGIVRSRPLAMTWRSNRHRGRSPHRIRSPFA